MSYQEKRSIVNMAGTLLITMVYSFFVYQRLDQGGMNQMNDLSFWGKVFLLLIPISIVAKIIINIVFIILNRIATRETEPLICDERDKLIELRSLRISHWMFVFGFLLAMASQAIGMPPFAMFLLLVFFGLLSDIAGEITQFTLYRKGF